MYITVRAARDDNEVPVPREQRCSKCYPEILGTAAPPATRAQHHCDAEKATKGATSADTRSQLWYNASRNCGCRSCHAALTAAKLGSGHLWMQSRHSTSAARGEIVIFAQFQNMTTRTMLLVWRTATVEQTHLYSHWVETVDATDGGNGGSAACSFSGSWGAEPAPVPVLLTLSGAESKTLAARRRVRPGTCSGCAYCEGRRSWHVPRNEHKYTVYNGKYITQMRCKP
jgi:hypothetical protein